MFELRNGGWVCARWRVTLLMALACAGPLLAQPSGNPPDRDGGPPPGFDFPPPDGMAGFGGPPPFGPGGPRGAMREIKLVKQFDQNADGWLNRGWGQAVVPAQEPVVHNHQV